MDEYWLNLELIVTLSWRWEQYIPPKRWHPPSKLQCESTFKYESSVGTVIHYSQDNQGIGIRFLVGETDFSVLPSHQAGTGAHPASYPGVKRPERESDHSPPSAAEFKNVWVYTFPLPHVFMVSCLTEHRDFAFHT
jgi:hypothetical protein